MRLICTGSRVWNDRDLVKAWLEILQRDQRPSVVRVGDEPHGADHMVYEVCIELGLAVEPHKALWKIWGDAAGPIRNRLMIDMGADLVLAFRHPGVSAGTDDCLRQAKAAGIPAIIVSPDGSFRNVSLNADPEVTQLSMGLDTPEVASDEDTSSWG